MTLVLYLLLNLSMHSLVVKGAVIFKTKGKWIKLHEGEHFHLLMSFQRVDFTHNLAKWYQGISTVAKYKKYYPHNVITGFIIGTVSGWTINQCETVSSKNKQLLANLFLQFQFIHHLSHRHIILSIDIEVDIDIIPEYMTLYAYGLSKQCSL